MYTTSNHYTIYTHIKGEQPYYIAKKMCENGIPQARVHLLSLEAVAPLHSGKCFVRLLLQHTRQVEQKPGGRGRGREWATLGVHPLSWLLSNNQLEKVPFVSVPHTSSNRLLLSNQDKGCTPSVAHSLPLPLGPALLNLSIYTRVYVHQHAQVKQAFDDGYSKDHANFTTLTKTNGLYNMRGKYKRGKALV